MAKRRSTPAKGRARAGPEPVQSTRASPDSDAADSVAGVSTAEIARTFGKRTSKVVQQAASILEEELAAGIVAARQMADKFVGPRARSSNPEDLLPRFRKDAHEVVDMLIDVLTAGSRSVGKLAQRVVKVRVGPRTGRRASGGASVPTLSSGGPVPAGQDARLEMLVENDGGESTDEFEFHSTDLVSETGDRIPASAVRFEPSLVVLKPGQRTKVVVEVQVPESASQGSYAAVLQATKLGQLRAMLVIRVGDADAA